MQPPDTPLDLPAFLRRLSAVMGGGRNAEMLALAADEIEALRRRAEVTEERFREQQDEIRRLQVEVADSEARAAQFAADMKAHIGELGAVAEARIAELAAEVENLRSQAQAIDETIAVVPVEQLRLARAQFDYLAQGFAGSGDVISLTICQIGACAIDKALGVGNTEINAPPNAAVRAI